MPTVWRGNYVVEDPDAAAYLDAVEVADGQSLEPDTRTAVNTFVEGCKFDGIWDAIKASCIMAGARTLAGALVPLVGTAPTNNNFVSGDYDRETGLKGDASTKYLNSNRADNADPQDSAHVLVYVTSIDTGWNTTGAGAYIGVSNPGFNSRRSVVPYNSLLYTSCRSNAGFTGSNGDITGSIGAARSNSDDYETRVDGVTNSRTYTSVAPSSYTVAVFAENTFVGETTLTDARLSFYSIGESLDLALLDARVSTLMTDLAAAIP